MGCFWVNAITVGVLTQGFLFVCGQVSCYTCCCPGNFPGCCHALRMNVAIGSETCHRITARYYQRPVRCNSENLNVLPSGDRSGVVWQCDLNISRRGLQTPCHLVAFPEKRLRSHNSIAMWLGLYNNAWADWPLTTDQSSQQINGWASRIEPNETTADRCALRTCIVTLTYIVHKKGRFLFVMVIRLPAKSCCSTLSYILRKSTSDYW